MDNPQVREEFLGHLLLGATEKAACLAVREDPNNFYRLKAEAKFLLGETKSRPKWMPPSHVNDDSQAQKIKDFYRDVKAAEAKCEISITESITQAIKEGRASVSDGLAFLAKRYPQRWGKHPRAIEFSESFEEPPEPDLPRTKTATWDEVMAALHELDRREREAAGSEDEKKRG